MPGYVLGTYESISFRRDSSSTTRDFIPEISTFALTTSASPLLVLFCLVRALSLFHYEAIFNSTPPYNEDTCKVSQNKTIRKTLYIHTYVLKNYYIIRRISGEFPEDVLIVRCINIYKASPL